MRLCNKLFLLGSIATMTACSSQDNTLYYWGNHPDVLYAYYNESGELAKQEQALREIIQQAEGAGKTVAPGIYGHLGLVTLKQGKRAEASNAFQKEKELYPESAKFMQYLQSKTK